MRNVLLTVCCFLACSATPSRANQILRLTPSQLLARSDLIVVARALDVRDETTSDGKLITIADLQVAASIKGAANRTLRIVTDFDSPEEDFAKSVRTGKNYVLYLKRDRAGRLRSVNGQHGAIELQCH